ncbi:TPA: hypothetical protein QEG05_000209 [Stenotrophomonas maltophilia]|nr:hypothetical protein [Stenotrophomonas maltophilia]HDS1230527.1 hypothetical protein [Stenotrophomonas maltophilia]
MATGAVTKWLNDKAVYGSAAVYVTGSYAFGRYVLSELNTIWPWNTLLLFVLAFFVLLGLTITATAVLVKAHHERTGAVLSSLKQSGLFFGLAISCGFAWYAGIQVERMVQDRKENPAATVCKHVSLPQAESVERAEVALSDSGSSDPDISSLHEEQ